MMEIVVCPMCVEEGRAVDLNGAQYVVCERCRDHDEIGCVRGTIGIALFMGALFLALRAIEWALE